MDFGGRFGLQEPWEETGNEISLPGTSGRPQKSLTLFQIIESASRSPPGHGQDHFKNRDVFLWEIPRENHRETPWENPWETHWEHP